MAPPGIGKFRLPLFALFVLAFGYVLTRIFWGVSVSNTFPLIAQKAFYYPLIGLFRNSILTAPFWCVVILTLGLERLVPAKPAQKLMSVSFAQDLVWFFYETVLHALIIVTYVDLLTYLYANHFSTLTITSLNQLPGWGRLVLAALLVDLLYWGQHYVNHKVPLLWQFHKVHHSQKELNFFTDFRYHVLEYIVRNTFLVIPFLILRIDVPLILAFVLFQKWHSRFYHGNIRTNLGVLRYFLVTPQSHRVHHSVEYAHRDTNFGALFSIWDFLLGTQHRNYNVYPETGIADEEFPHETTVGLRSLLLTPLHQMLYPFHAIRRQKKASNDSPNLGLAVSPLTEVDS